MSEITDQCNIKNKIQHDIDEIVVLRLELMDQLIKSKRELEKSLREGYFLLGKARYIMGTNSVSMLQIPSSDCDVQPLYCTTTDQIQVDEVPLMSSHKFEVNLAHSMSLSEENQKVDSHGSEGLRKRGGESQSGGSISNEKSSKKNDPLLWFSALSPQSLKAAQSHFKQAIFKSVECATIQSKLNALR